MSNKFSVCFAIQSTGITQYSGVARGSDSFSYILFIYSGALQFCHENWSISFLANALVDMSIRGHESVSFEETPCQRENGVENRSQTHPLTKEVEQSTVTETFVMQFRAVGWGSNIQMKAWGLSSLKIMSPIWKVTFDWANRQASTQINKHNSLTTDLRLTRTWKEKNGFGKPGCERGSPANLSKK